MAKVDRAYLKTLADMSHLHFSDEELVSLGNDIESVLSYVECLSQSPYAQDMQHLENRTDCAPLRQDEVVFTNPMDILCDAPDVAENFFIVPSIIKHEGKGK
ncbi:MAG: hypothetical protein UU47_C0007G0034 [candidate division TM6 bacterium GW2011_GWE2_41_16]|nr:MAG: hypothetical protein UU47_C0007G0034 [candidate division TM6 bacterium GW2011_GWE2_41_16]